MSDSYISTVMEDNNIKINIAKLTVICKNLHIQGSPPVHRIATGPQDCHWFTGYHGPYPGPVIVTHQLGPRYEGQLMSDGGA